MDSKAQAVKNAIELVLEKNINDIKTIGVGSGSTVAIFITEIADFLTKTGRINAFKFVSTSIETEMMLRSAGINLIVPVEYNSVDITFDGADEIYEKDNVAIKGGGACMFYEKIVAHNSKKLVLMGTKSKSVDVFKFKVPVEIAQIAVFSVKQQIMAEFDVLGVELRHGGGKLGPVVTDGGNLVLDVGFRFETIGMAECAKLDEQIKRIPGVIETGFFVRMADLFVDEEGCRSLSK